MQYSVVKLSKTEKNQMSKKVQYITRPGLKSHLHKKHQWAHNEPTKAETAGGYHVLQGNGFRYRHWFGRIQILGADEFLPGMLNKTRNIV